MRRALLAVIAGGTLLAGAACDSDASSTETPAAAPTAAATTAPSSAPPDYTANTEKVCAQLQKVYTGDLRDFGTALGRMITYKEAKQTAEAKKAEGQAAAELRAAAAKIRKDTSVAQNPEFKAAGATSAAKVQASAVDRRYIKKITTLKQLNGTIEAQLNEWLSPVAGYCGPS